MVWTFRLRRLTKIHGSVGSIGQTDYEIRITIEIAGSVSTTEKTNCLWAASSIVL